MYAMKFLTVLIAGVAALTGCAVTPSQTLDRRSDAVTRPTLKLVAAGLNGDCPRTSPLCEIFLTIVDTDPKEGGPGSCEVAIPVTEIKLHSNPQVKQVVRWKILNGKDFGFTGPTSGPNHAVVISPNRVPNGDPAFENNKFTVPGSDDQYEWQSTGKQTGSVNNGYTVYAYRKLGNLACDTKDPPIVNQP